MKYRNPLAFLEKMNGAAIDSADTAAVSLLRKKILAELELTADKGLQINGEWCSKNDLLLFFDSLQNKKELHFHQEIKSDPVLSEFLATGIITGLFADKALYKDKSFLSFIAPFYGPLFTTAVLNSLLQQQVVTLQYLFNNPVLLDGEAMKRCYDKVFRLLKEQYARVEEVRAALAKDARERWEQVDIYIGARQVQLLNALPDAFHMQRSDYGILLINFALVLNTNHYKEEALEILGTLQQLKSVSYVQENVEKYIRYVKEDQAAFRSVFFRKEPTTWLGKLLAQRGLTNDRLIQIGCSIFIVLVILLGNYYGKKETHQELFTPVVEESTFSGSRTYWTMQYLLSQLAITPPDPVESIQKHPAIATPATGDDLYGPAFMEAIRKQGNVGAEFVQPRYSQSLPRMREDGRWEDSLHRQSLCVFNRQDAQLITMILTPDSFYSCYIAPHDSAFIPLPLSLSKVYFYVGLLWNPDWLGYWAMKYVPSYTVKGFFMLPGFNHDIFLRKSAVRLILDTAYWKTSNRYIPMEVSASAEQVLHLKQLSDNTNGVDMKIGE
ncbi:hypothetical protein [Chitinophaga sp. RAB17]|uniref:hypothetical protein n=1 Tax=Chitinophaga sp. RAB17 TaxID=3233049 RepID=UPI003F91F1B9